MRRVLWSGPARDDVLGIPGHYYELDPSPADLIADRTVAAAAPLLANPFIGSSVEGDGERKWRVRQTPFRLFYVSRADDIEVRRVVHARSDWNRS